ncbi:MAG: hypothetical protein F4065_08820 [Rhodothermaceae bacterium]|nr:hypothetical protein [Rhodothermaceae bacterium]MXZ58872.1 hypothetical protein [Rhodothermaceae bacterium]MYB89996.1 hypothetical protein [Rhodothermaceae bacterium]MYD68440.1 hypothetical protein [Rhodothermaceae bacterium]MYG43737.1 hypothetical protein [Rhodothermaceae bacterium]
MGLIDSDSISTIEDEVLDVRPWISEYSGPKVKFHVTELSSREVFHSIGENDDRGFTPITRRIQVIRPRPTPKDTVASRDESIRCSPSSFSREVFSRVIRNRDRNSDPINLLWNSLSTNISVRFQGNPSDIITGKTDPAAQVNNATQSQEIFDILDHLGRRKIAERLKYLHEITQDDDPEDPAMNFMSLRELAQFFIGDGKSLPYPQIGISPNGLLQAEWRSKKTSAVMKFLADGNTRFAGTTSDKGGRQTIQGSGTKMHALKSILPFINYSYS